MGRNWQCPSSLIRRDSLFLIPQSRFSAPFIHFSLAPFSWAGISLALLASRMPAASAMAILLEKQLVATIFAELCLFQKMLMNAHCCASVGCCQVDLINGSQKGRKTGMAQRQGRIFHFAFYCQKE
jgi:hypothetical protein